MPSLNELAYSSVPCLVEALDGGHERVYMNARVDRCMAGTWLHMVVCFCCMRCSAPYRTRRLYRRIGASFCAHSLHCTLLLCTALHQGGVLSGGVKSCPLV